MKVDRSILASNDQSMGMIADPDKLESSIAHLANVIDSNDDVKLDKTGNLEGTWQGYQPLQVSEGINSQRIDKLEANKPAYVKFASGFDKISANSNTWTTVLWTSENSHTFSSSGVFLDTAKNELVFNKKGVYLFTISCALSGLNIGQVMKLGYTHKNSSDATKTSEEQLIQSGSDMAGGGVNDNFVQGHFNFIINADEGDKLSIVVLCSELRTVRWTRVNGIEAGSF